MAAWCQKACATDKTFGRRGSLLRRPDPRRARRQFHRKSLVAARMDGNYRTGVFAHDIFALMQAAGANHPRPCSQADLAIKVQSARAVR